MFCFSIGVPISCLTICLLETECNRSGQASLMLRGVLFVMDTDERGGRRMRALVGQRWPK